MNAYSPIFVEITDEPIEAARPFVDRNGAAKTIPAKQNAYIHSGGRYPVKIVLAVDDAIGPLRPGRYLLGGEPFSVGEYDRAKFNDRKMQFIPMDDAIKALQGLGKLSAAA